MQNDRIVVVDDEAVSRDAIHDMLQNNGYQTILATNVEGILTLKIPVRVVVLDIFMPGMGGIQGIVKIREKWPNAKIIAVSGGWGKDMDKHKALEAASRIGADAVLAKPFEEEELLAVLARVQGR
jgi:DNA-binding response OmpR family regulator